MPTKADKIAGGLLGLLIGDALGVPYEFHGQHKIPPKDKIEMAPPADFPRAHADVAPGTWSDDGAQALVLLDSLLACDGLDLTHFANGLLGWYQLGHYAIGRMVFDVGIQTGQALRRIYAGGKADEAGSTAEHANGNGSLMRVLPLALWHRGSDRELAGDAMRQSIVTHGHLRSQVCCAIYCLWARAEIAGVPQAWQAALATFRQLYPAGSPEFTEWETSIAPAADAVPQGSGYVVDCLFSARDALRQSTYEDVVKAAIALGDDTDTTACVAGGLAGIRHGVEGIPRRWRDQLRGQELFSELLKRLLVRVDHP